MFILEFNCADRLIFFFVIPQKHYIKLPLYVYNVISLGDISLKNICIDRFRYGTLLGVTHDISSFIIMMELIKNSAKFCSHATGFRYAFCFPLLSLL